MCKNTPFYPLFCLSLLFPRCQGNGSPLPHASDHPAKVWRCGSGDMFLVVKKQHSTSSVKPPINRGVPSHTLFKDFARIFNYFSLHFRNLRVTVFMIHLSVDAFKVINIHCIFSFLYFLQFLQIVFSNTFFFYS